MSVTKPKKAENKNDMKPVFKNELSETKTSTDHITGVERSPSLFPLDKDRMPKPDKNEYIAFIKDSRHFSLIKNLHLADLITLCNGFSGFYSIILCLRYMLTHVTKYLYFAQLLIIFGLFFDYFDGRVARIRNKSSLMGQELDSLADLISFGVAPAILAFSIGFQTTVDVLFLSFWMLCGLTRLARYNVCAQNMPKDSSGKIKHYEGMPIPTNFLLVILMSFFIFKSWTYKNLPGGLLFKNTLLEFHSLTIIFFLQGCSQILKSLKIKKI